MKETHLTRSQLAILHDADAAIFPNALPFSHLLSWYHASLPECFISLGEEHVGSIIALLLPDHAFRGLCTGALEEKIITSGDIQEANGVLSHGTAKEKSSLGLHFWHVERTDQWRQETKASFATVLEDYMMRWYNKYGISQFSALTASHQGEALFTKLTFNVVGIYDLVYHGVQSNGIRHYTETQTDKLDALQDSNIYPCRFMKRCL